MSTTKMPLAWHERGLANMQASLLRHHDDLVRLQTRCALLKEQIDLYKKQIDTAKAEGRDGFDPDKYLISRK